MEREVGGVGKGARRGRPPVASKPGLRRGPAGYREQGGECNGEGGKRGGKHDKHLGRAEGVLNPDP
jgi:hypothetical protein